MITSQHPDPSPLNLALALSKALVCSLISKTSAHWMNQVDIYISLRIVYTRISLPSSALILRHNPPVLEHLPLIPFLNSQILEELYER